MTLNRFFLITASTAMAIMAAACKTDVPVPEDEQAKEWTGSIKESYPGWQPTQSAPKGNTEYESLFANKPVTELQPQEMPPQSSEAVPQLTQAAAAIPSTTRIDITETGSIVLDGTAVSDAQLQAGMLEKYLSDIAAAHKENSMAIIHALSPKAPVEKFNVVLDLCRKTGIAKVRFVAAEGNKGAGAHSAKSSGKRLVVVVDESQPATEYVVKKGDTLSKIAQKVYKNGGLWNIIYKANKSKIKNPNSLVLNMKLSIPAIKTVEAAR